MMEQRLPTTAANPARQHRSEHTRSRKFFLTNHTRLRALLAPVEAPQNPRDVILESATHAFYTNGVYRTTTEDILVQANVSRRIYSKFFPTKEALILAYLDTRHERELSLFATVFRSALTPELTLNVVLSEVVAELNDPGFRGCAFINAAIECRDSPAVLDAVRQHREWYVGAATEVLRRAGHAHPADAADDLMLARDGAMTSGYGGDVVSMAAALRRVVDRVLSEIPGPKLASGF